MLADKQPYPNLWIRAVKPMSVLSEQQLSWQVSEPRLAEEAVSTSRQNISFVVLENLGREKAVSTV
jgi:hypothetical protein